MPIRPLAGLLAAAFLVAPGLAAQQAPDRLALADYLNFEDVQNPQLSPDGSQIIFTRRWVDQVNDRWESSLWIMDADGSRLRFLVNGSDVQWSPDGRRIAYLARVEPAGTQVHVRWMDAEGSVTQVTRVERAPTDVRWSPDGSQLAFRMLIPTKERWTVALPAAPQGAKWVEAPYIVERLAYRRDRAGFTDQGFQQLFVVPADGGTPRQVTDGSRIPLPQVMAGFRDSGRLVPRHSYPDSWGSQSETGSNAQSTGASVQQ
jgi:dipeptidyl aminopeptidase/acylaminoacyl peptidase